jgi:phage tail-like protein
MPATGARVDPFRNFNFLVEIDGVTQVSFIGCKGLDATTEVIETREGGENTTVKKLPGKTTYADITLTWGMNPSVELWRWRQDVIDGTITRRNGSIVVYDLANKNEVGRWNFFNAWPSKWDGPGFDAKGSDIAIETLVLTIEGITRA